MRLLWLAVRRRLEGLDGGSMGHTHTTAIYRRAEDALCMKDDQIIVRVVLHCMDMAVKLKADV